MAEARVANQTGDREEVEGDGGGVSAGDPPHPWDSELLPFGLPWRFFPRLVSLQHDGDFVLFCEAAKLIRRSRAKDTFKTYGTVVNKLRAYLATVEKSMLDLSSDDVVKWVLGLSSDGAPYSFWKKVNAVLLCLQEMSGKRLMTNEVETFVKGGTKQATDTREAVVKKVPLVREVIEEAVQKYIAPYLTDIYKIKIGPLRVIFRWLIYYESLCRFDDFSKLQACHFKVYSSEVEIYFPSWKNSQTGHTHFIASEPDDAAFDPVTVINLYFKRCRFSSAESGLTDHSYVNCIERTSGRQNWADGRRSLSYTTALEAARKVLDDMGYDPSCYGEKSARVGGAAAGLNKNPAAVETMLLGGWKSPKTASVCQHNSKEFKLALSRKFQKKRKLEDGAGGEVNGGEGEQNVEEEVELASPDKQSR